MRIVFVLFIIVCYLFDSLHGFNCPNERNAMYSNINDPHSFWHCVHGQAYLKPCPRLLVWSPEQRKCIRKRKYSSGIILDKIKDTCICILALNPVWEHVLIFFLEKRLR